MSTIPSLALIPSGVKASKVYSVLPTDGTGDFYFTRSGNATRVNSEGLIETVSTNIPRLNYPLIDGVVQGCPSLLLEPERTNNLQRSEEFGDAYWVNAGVTITSNAIISPKGDLTADLLTGVSGAFGVVRFLTWTATNKVASCFAKKGSSNIFRIANASGGGGSVNFDLENGVLGTISSGFEGKIENYGNGWYRCTAIDTLGRTGTLSLGVTAASESVYIWGAQLEAGSYATSYIPTQGSIVTRVAETCSKTGISSLINSSEGVLYAEIGALANDLTTKQLSLSDGTLNNRIVLGFPSSGGVVYFEIRNGGTAIAFVSVPVASVVDISKIAVKFKNDDFALWINGIEVAIDNSGILPTGLNRLAFDNGNATGGQFYGNCKDLRVYTTALSDSELQALTQI